MLRNAALPELHRRGVEGSSAPRLDVDNPFHRRGHRHGAGQQVPTPSTRRSPPPTRVHRGALGATDPADRADVLRALAGALEARFDSLAEGLVTDTGLHMRLAPLLQAGAPLAHLRDFADMAPLLAAPVPFPIQTTPGLGQWELHASRSGWSPASPPTTSRCSSPSGRPRRPCWPATRGAQTLTADAVRAQRAGRGVPARFGLPPGVLNIVHGDRMAGEALVAHRGSTW